MTKKHRSSRRENPKQKSIPFAEHYRVDGQSIVFVPKKQLGQNFLVDKNIIDKMIAACALNPDDDLLEVGPGLGVLTHRMAPLVRKIIAVETDVRLTEALKKETHHPNLEIIHEDFLQLDLSGLPERMKAVGNLPYYITTPILDKILKNRKHFSSVFLTVQLELGQRLIAQPCSKDYSALTLFIQYFCDVRLLFKIKNTSFKPAPKVHSCFLQLTIHEAPRFPAIDEEFLFATVRRAFQHRRKTLPKALEGFLPKDQVVAGLKELSLDEKIRPDQIPLQDFVRLANLLKGTNQGNGK